MAETQELQSLRVTTAAGRGKRDVEEFLEVWGRSILRMEMDAIDGAPLEVDLTLRALPRLAVASGSLSPMCNRHTEALVDNDDFILVVIERGAAEMRQHGRIVPVGNGEAVLTANGAAGSFAGLTPTRVINFRLDRAIMQEHVARMDDRTGQPIARGNRALELLVGYAGVLDDSRALATPELRRAVALHLHELAALAVVPENERTGIQRGGGIRAARLHAIKADTLTNLASHDLTPGAVALRHGITPRYLNLLFEPEGISFSEFVLAQRLAEARRLLLDPRNAARRISAIAYDVGFGDLSHFNRSFRRRFGMTPGEARRGDRK
ncbi:MAG TPA: helix-turn-helix transcriptional regulator [Bauldia sp.]|nr:helix-turn-helix transcriptional regulator [Bauldia sp.]